MATETASLEEIESGLLWIYQDSDLAIASSGGTFAIGLDVPFDGATVTFLEITHEIPSGTVVVYEVATFTGGTPQLPINANRNAGNNPKTTLTSDVTRTGGVAILTEPLLAVKNTVDVAESDGQIVLRNSTRYIVEITNSDSQARAALIKMRYTEAR